MITWGTNSIHVPAVGGLNWIDWRDWESPWLIAFKTAKISPKLNDCPWGPKTFALERIWSPLSFTPSFESQIHINNWISFNFPHLWEDVVLGLNDVLFLPLPKLFFIGLLLSCRDPLETGLCPDNLPIIQGINCIWLAMQISPSLWFKQNKVIHCNRGGKYSLVVWEANEAFLADNFLPKQRNRWVNSFIHLHDLIIRGDDYTTII